MDTSGSMRGFALSATANRRDAAAEYQGILAAIESVAETLVKNGDERRPDSAATHEGEAPVAPLTRLRFGSAIEQFAPDTSLLDVGVGRTAAHAMGGRPLGPNWRSSDCAERWTGSPGVRSAIDELYSEDITCLNPVFDVILADSGSDRAYIVLTDAEQGAPETDARCAAAKNLGNIQARLHQWVQRGNYAAAVVFKLHSFPWQSTAVGRRYCACDSRLLFAYVLTPSAEVAEQIFSHLSTNWKGPADAIAYLPFTPRGASQFALDMAIASTAEGTAANVRGDDEPHLADPEAGVLPQLWIRLQASEVQLTFTLKHAGFEDSETRKGAGFAPLDWTKAAYEWLPPQRVERVSGQSGSPGVRLSSEAQGLSFTRITKSTSAVGAAEPEARTVHYHWGTTLLDQTHLTGPLGEVTFVVRKRPNQTKGCEYFIVEVKARLTDVLDQLTARLPLVRDATSPCLSLETLRSQVQFVYGSAPIARFILHVDY